MFVTETHAAGTLYRAAFHNATDPVPTTVDASTFDGTDWLDADGYLKPGTPLKESATAGVYELAGTGAAEEATRVLPYAVRMGPVDGTGPDVPVAAQTRGDVIRSHVESALGRALTANEVTALTASDLFRLV